MVQIPLVDLRAQFGQLRAEIEESILSVIETSDFILGQAVSFLEEEFARYVGTRFAVGVSSGTDALVLLLKACRIGPGDEVIVPACTFVATAFAVSLVGAKPVFSDISEHDSNVDVSKIPDAISERTKAILPVHLYGRMADMEGLQRIADRSGLLLIEDACQAHGASNNAKKAGCYGTGAAFSFYPGKNLGAFGDGGMVTTSDEAIAEAVRMLRNYGQKRKYHHELLGHNCRLDTIQAAILRVKLKKLDNWNDRRRRLADLYREYLSDLPVTLPHDAPDGSHVYHLFVIRVAQRDALLGYLNSQGIGAGVHYPVPTHLHPPYREMGYREGLFPVAERLCSEVLSLPIYPEMSDDAVGKVCELVRRFYREQE